MKRLTASLALACALALGACGALDGRSPESYLLGYDAVPPNGTTVTVCSGYGCTYKSRVTLSSADLGHLQKIMGKGEAGAEAERAALAEAIAWLETRVGEVTGLSADRDHRDLMSGGDRTQADCIDEAANTTSYLLLLHTYAMLQHHNVRHPTSKGILINGVYPHATALIEERKTDTIWAVDSWIYANGEPPVIVPLDVWRKTGTEELKRQYGRAAGQEGKV